MPCAAWAEGEVCGRLARRLLADDGTLDKVQGLVAPDLLVVLGEAADLPWVDGVAYLGRDDAAPSLLLPTHLAPTVPATLLESALGEKLGDHGASVAVLVTPSLASARFAVLSAGRPFDRNRLADWLRERRA